MKKAKLSGNKLWFYCPGCKMCHYVPLPKWTFNGNEESPSFTPSLVSEPDIPEARCHLTMTDGKITYMKDCHHELKNQTVEMEELK